MVGRLNKMSAIRKKSNTVTTVQKYFQQKHYVSHLSVWNVQCALGMFSYACRCYSKQISARRCTAAEKPFGTSDGKDRNWKQIMSKSGPSSSFKASRHRNGYFFVDVASGVLQQRGVIDLFIHYHSTWCHVRNFSVSSSFWILLSLQRWFMTEEIWRWSILWYEEKGSLPLNGPEGDWKMAFICHTPNSDSNYSILSRKKKESWHCPVHLFEGVIEDLWMGVGVMTWNLRMIKLWI